MNINRYLDALLDATAVQATAKARVDRLRDVLEAEARRRWKADNAAPSWKATLGKVRLDGTNPEAQVAVTDPEAWASWVAQRHPDAVTATVTVPSGQLEAALGALGFAGVDVTTTTATVDPKWTTTALDGLCTEVLEKEVDDSGEGNVRIEREVLVTDPTGTLSPDPGEVLDLPGVTAKAPDPAPRLVVILDSARKRAAIEAADAEAAAVVAAIEAEEATAAEPSEATA